MLSQIVPILLVVILGFFIRIKKPTFLIPSPNLVAGPNIYKKEDMKKYDIDALSKFVSNMMFIVAFLLLIRLSLHYLGLSVLSMLINLFIFLFVVICVIYANIGNRFKKKI